jgi:glycylpeptide N-tetradecanoyltransferase
MAEDSKIDDLPAKQEAASEVIAEAQASSSTATKVESEDDQEQADVPQAAEGGASAATGKKKKSKRKRIKAALAGGTKNEETSKEDISKAVSGLNKSQIADLLAMNPALAKEIGGTDGDLSSKKTAEAFKKLSLQEIMTGLAAGGKNAKDMASYKFWQTQPVPKLDDKKDHIEEGPFKIIDPERVPKEPPPLTEGFEWVTMDLTREEELKEVFDLLDGHYVEDEEAMFRFNYSASFLKWYFSLWTDISFANAHQGFTSTWLEQRMACRRSSIPVTEACRFHLSHSRCPASKTKSVACQRGKLPLHTQKASIQTIGTSPHQGDHEAMLPVGDMASYLYRWSGSANTCQYMQVLS